MTPAEIRPFAFKQVGNAWRSEGDEYRNWPVVYVLDGGTATRPKVYVGETVNASARMQQHGKSKSAMRTVRVIIDSEFNKSVCLDLEATLIRWFDGEGRFEVTNRNAGIADADYFDQARYRAQFVDIFEQLQTEGLFQKSIREIEDSDLFKLSPFKSLTADQKQSVRAILDRIVADRASHATDSPSARAGASHPSLVVEGGPGTGKTIVAIFLLKLLADIDAFDQTDSGDVDGAFVDFFEEPKRQHLKGLRVGLVVPQQSLRKSVERVFRKTPGLHRGMVLTPWEVGAATDRFDLLLVDESHRLTQRASQSSGALNARFPQINERLYGFDDESKSQLDWVQAQSVHNVLFIDPAQTVRPADLPLEVVRGVIGSARVGDRHFSLKTQMRVKAGSDYIGFVDRLLRRGDAALPDLGEYDFRVFDDAKRMRLAVLAKNEESGLARMVAGYAWKWVSKRSGKTPHAIDIHLDGAEMQWNRTDKDWIRSTTSPMEVGSIHTVQGYDLNYAGVIIGPDLRFDEASGKFHTRREWIFDAKGKENSKKYGRSYSEEQLLEYVQNIYAVLMTRGILGTYVYAVDPGVRAVLRRAVGRGGVSAAQ